MTSPLFTSIAFDATLTSVFVPWITGGAVWIPRELELGSAVKEILTSPVDTMTLTPSHLRLFIENGFQESAIRRMIVGGENFPAELARRVLEQRPMRIFNLYGPTEATVGCIVHEFDPEKDSEATIPIGLPIRNTRAVLRGGELLLGGDCLAEGYEGRPAFGELYATGDLVSWEGGKLHCHGRSDDQVKVRGQRIEPAEVEAAILESGLVTVCVVRAENNKLVAFLVWKGEGDVGLLREHLERLIPKAWIPDFFHALPALPLSANGKVDGKALAVSFPVVESEAIATPLEMELMEMAAEIMQVSTQQIQADLPLHEMGFDSLQLLLLLTRAGRRFKPEEGKFGFLGPDFFRAPTIAGLARALEGGAG
jgi:tyrocidine synthetase-3